MLAPVVYRPDPGICLWWSESPNDGQVAADFDSTHRHVYIFPSQSGQLTVYVSFILLHPYRVGPSEAPQ